MARRLQRASRPAKRLGFGRPRSQLGGRSPPLPGAVFALGVSAVLQAGAPSVAAVQSIEINAPAASLEILVGEPWVDVGTYIAAPGGSMEAACGTTVVWVEANVAPPAASATLRSGTPACYAVIVASVEAPGAGAELAASTPTVLTTVPGNISVVPPAVGAVVAAVGPEVAVQVFSVLADAPAGAMVATGAAPAVFVGCVAQAPGASAQLRGGTPTVATISVVAVAQPGASAAMVGGTPSVLIANIVAVSPPAASMTATATAPTVVAVNSALAAPSGQSILLSGAAPSLRTTASMTAPGASVEAFAVAPAVRISRTVAAPAASMTAAGSVPECYVLPAPETGKVLGWNASGHIVNLSVTEVLDQIASDTLRVGWWIDTSAVSSGVSVAPAGASASLAASAPAVAAGGGAAVIAPAASMLLAGSAPVVSKTVAIAQVGAAMTVQAVAPTVAGSATSVGIQSGFPIQNHNQSTRTLPVPAAGTYTLQPNQYVIALCAGENGARAHSLTNTTSSGSFSTAWAAINAANGTTSSGPRITMWYGRAGASGWTGYTTFGTSVATEVYCVIVPVTNASGSFVAANANGTSGPLTATVSAQGTGSLILAIGWDWVNSAARTLAAGNTMLDEWPDGSSNTAFVARRTAVTTGPGNVTIATTAPTSTVWRMSIVEVRRA